MKIEIISISKKEKTFYEPIYKEFYKMISRYAKIEDIEIFNKEILNAHKSSSDLSKKVYTKVLEPLVSNSYTVSLDPNGKIIDSYEFSKLLDGKMSIKFFIGGAYGFEESFLKKTDKIISLGKLTLSHKIAKLVLLEQIYRGFSILNHHPYHK